MVTEAEQSEIKKRVAEAAARLKSWGFPKNIEFDPGCCKCLNCGRIVLCGPPCCNKPEYRK